MINNKNLFDAIVIGGGPGGYIAAIRLAQLGKKVACIDSWKNINSESALGGTCTNIGCIPSKALLQSSEHFEQLNKYFSVHGISAENVKIDINKMIARKNKIVKNTNDGILYLFKKNKVKFFHGIASFKTKQENNYVISIDNKEEILSEQIIVATGSVPRNLPNLIFDEKNILSNDGALSLKEVPKKLAIIGAGVIGLELGSVWRRLGSEVTILEALDKFLPSADEQIAREAKKYFERQGLKTVLGAEVLNIQTINKTNQEQVIVKYKNSLTNQEYFLEVDKLIVSIGRIPNTAGLKPENIGLVLDERGFIAVDENCRTNLSGVWAVGDVVRGPMLAHKAEEEGVAVAERIAGQHGHVNFATIPNVIYTQPEIAWIGLNEAQLKEQGRNYKTGTFPFLANGRARALGDTSGLVKIIADRNTDEVLGVHMIGPLVSELIAEVVLAMEFKASSEDIARTCHAHPTLSEATKEAALAVDKRALNF